MQRGFKHSRMDGEKLLKITYHVGSADKTKINAYLKMPSPIYATLLREIAMCVFDQHKQPETEVRTYWIDEDGDEIEVVNQCDYEIFMSERSERRHLQVAPIRVAAASKDSGAKNANVTDQVNPNAKSVHLRIECDGCKMAPIVGFRYKCIQCSNYDLCEKCEMNHMHAEHMMVRMPNQNSPDVIETWITGRGSGRRHHKHGANVPGVCPFVFGGDMSSPGGKCRTPKTGSGDCNGSKTPTDGGKQHHGGRHGHKHQRRQMQNGIFTHLYNMMQDLAEGGGPVLDEDLENDAKIAAAAAAAHEAAQDAATKAAAAVASATAAATAAAQATFSFSPEASTPEAPKNTGTKPKTPPPTPNNNMNINEPNLTQTKQATNETKAPKISENKDNVTDTSQTTPVLNSPIFENVAQYVDPQYMKAGIQILNNFSEMFAKMLDPMEGGNVSGTQCPFQPAGFPQQRKSSVSSTASSNVSTASTTSSTNDKAAQQSQPQTQTAATETLENDGAVGGTSNEPVSTAETEKLPERRRSQSEETDWQIIDQQPITETPIETLVDLSPSADSPKTPIKTPNVQTINYVQLSKDLQAHIDQEKQKEQAKSASAEPQIETTPVAAPPVTAAPPTAPTEEKRGVPVFHADPRINNAVNAMMAMGFSNEGAWLTQLLESVNGSIPQALDLMSGAGRNK